MNAKQQECLDLLTDLGKDGRTTIVLSDLALVLRRAVGTTIDYVNHLCWDGELALVSCTGGLLTVEIVPDVVLADEDTSEEATADGEEDWLPSLLADIRQDSWRDYFAPAA